MMIEFRVRAARAVLCLAAALVPLSAAGCGSSDSEARAGRGTGIDPALHRALPLSVLSSGVLRIETDASYAPAESFSPDGHTIVGFEPDLADALARVLGVKVRFVNA